MLNPDLALLEDELLAVQNLFGVSIFNQDPERLSPTMKSSVPLELFVGLKLKLKAYCASSDWLHEGANLKSRKFMHEAKNDLPHLWVLDQLTKALR
jgi:hypothetical protein